MGFKMLDLLSRWLIIFAEMAERFKAHAWKACEVKSLRRFESCSLRQQNTLHVLIYCFMQ